MGQPEHSHLTDRSLPHYIKLIIHPGSLCILLLFGFEQLRSWLWLIVDWLRNLCIGCIPIASYSSLVDWWSYLLLIARKIVFAFLPVVFSAVRLKKRKRKSQRLLNGQSALKSTNDANELLVELLIWDTLNTFKTSLLTDAMRATYNVLQLSFH